jgi:hypothetical protein
MRPLTQITISIPIFFALAACSSDGQAPDPDGSPDASTFDAGADLQPPDTAPPSCGTGDRPLPPGLVELAWDNGKAHSNIRAEQFYLTVLGNKVELAKEALYEAVRFELEHPARIHGFAVQWANIDTTDPEYKLEAGLYRDFGHNGFDFWAADPLWTGTRCAKDVVGQAKWLTYVFDKPVEIAQPGLVYVAQLSKTEKDPVFLFDDNSAPEGKCEEFDTCRSSVNLPEVLNLSHDGYFNGVTSSFPYNYLVRLYVEYTEQIQETDRIFHKLSDIPASKTSVAWGDYDNDGWDDLLVGGKLYHNDKGSTFSDVTAASGIEAIKAKAAGGVWGDYDNDGCLDLFLFSQTTTRADTLLKGDCKGGFADVTFQAQIVDQQSYNTCNDPKTDIRAPTAAAAWIDLDADGWLDLYLANFICWAKESYYRDTVFRNKGDGTFEEWTGTKGFNLEQLASRGVAPADHDGDGDVDLFVNSYRLHINQLFVNNGDGTVTESAKSAGVAGNGTPYDNTVYYGHTIGAAWGDLNNDGALDLVASNLAHPRFFHFSDRTQVLINDGKGNYKDLSGAWDKPFDNPAGLRYQETHSVPVLGDFDHDGDLDLAISCTYEGRPTDFYWGNGDGTFSLDVYHAGLTTKDGWGVAASDYDNDGDLDLFLTELYENTGKAAGKNHWFQVRAVGNVQANRAAIGATVRVTAGGKTWIRHVQGGSGKGCQDSLTLHFGLGSATTVDTISVTYPGGTTVKHSGPFSADQRVWVYEDGTTHLGWAPSP